ncbi:hypothetical protein QWY85_08775 [Neolewinella lacunae]|uniref:Uncharacterized protein n=1 Tax=Neolewinella lacunae TaxID=1517758 RepID=A0A923PP06_9BACT|nr:hypothetical protein [Neolewinella lacunae]MBC6996231.1 hypothetical protein [Neolewinella lacunae]MDN3634749.1 hypothetical protein [Neolewinella lacunae]
MAETSIFESKIDPVYQAGGALVAVFLFDVAGSAVAAGTEDVVNNRWPWLCAASFLLFFALFNAIMSATSANLMKYWGRSIYSFLGLAIGSGLLAWAFSGLSIYQAGSYKWIFFVVTFGYLVFLSMIAVMKKVVDFAQKEEWNSPKLRQRKRKR